LQQSETILVTGGAGFIGSHVVKKLLEKAYNIIVIDNLSNSMEQTLASCCNSQSGSKVMFYNIDIKDKNTIAHVLDQESIVSCVHLAAKISVSDSISNPDETVDINVNGTRNILEVCSDHNVDNFVFASSAAVYGDCKSLPVSEDDPLVPLSPYGVSKVNAERLVSSYNSSKIRNAISLRFFNVYGRGQTFDYAGVITKFAGRLRKNLPPIIYGNGMQTRDFIAVGDVVTAILLGIGVESGREKIPIQHDVYNVGTGKSTTIMDLAKMMIKVYSLDLQPTFAKSREGDVVHSYADITRIKRDYGFVASDNLESSLIEMYRAKI
jgi:UDP-glucose 4-epimerase